MLIYIIYIYIHTHIQSETNTILYISFPHLPGEGARFSTKVQLLHSLAPSVPSCSPVPNSVAPAPRLSARKNAIECQNFYQNVGIAAR